MEVNFSNTALKIFLLTAIWILLLNKGMTTWQGGSRQKFINCLKVNNFWPTITTLRKNGWFCIKYDLCLKCKTQFKIWCPSICFSFKNLNNYRQTCSGPLDYLLQIYFLSPVPFQFIFQQWFTVKTIINLLSSKKIKLNLIFSNIYIVSKSGNFINNQIDIKSSTCTVR